MDVSKISMEKIEIAVKDFNQEVYWRNENIKKYGEPFGMFIKIVYDKEINDLYVLLSRTNFASYISEKMTDMLT